MQPAVPQRVEIDQVNGVINAYVDKDQIKLAIGRNWQNARLAGQLLGMKMNILLAEEDSAFGKKLNEIIKSLAETLSIPEETAKLLANKGILSIEGLKTVDKNDLLAIEGLTQEAVNGILEAVKKLG